MDRFSGVDGTMSLSDVGNYAGLNENERKLREFAARWARRFSSHDTVDDLMREYAPVDIEYKMNARGEITSVELEFLNFPAPGIYVELPRGIVTAYYDGDMVSLDIQNPRGTDWMFDYYAEMAPKYE